MDENQNITSMTDLKYGNFRSEMTDSPTYGCLLREEQEKVTNWLEREGTKTAFSMLCEREIREPEIIEFLTHSDFKRCVGETDYLMTLLGVSLKNTFKID